MKKRVLSIVLCMVLALSLLPAAALAEETTTITKVEMTVTKPVRGARPSDVKIVTDPANATDVMWMGWGKIAADQYTPTATGWTLMDENETFEPGYYYAVQAGVYAKDGYILSADVSATINGKTNNGFKGDKGVYFYTVFEPLSAETAPDVYPVVTPAAETEEPATDVDEGTDEEEVVEDDETEEVEDVEDEEVEDVEDEEVDETEAEETEEEAEVTEDEAPKTGDASTNLWVALALVGCAAFAAAVVLMKRENA